MKHIRIISTLLAVCTVLGSFSALFAVGAAAAEAETQTSVKTEYNNPDEKVASMKKMLEGYGYELFVDEKSGEVALKNTADGSVLFSNPYDVASSKGSDETKITRLLSQIIIQYTYNGTLGTLYSYRDAAMRDQISVSKIKGGVRVSYVIGQEALVKLVPRKVPAAVFDALIKGPLDAANDSGNWNEPKTYNWFFTFYDFDDSDPKNPVWVFNMENPENNQLDNIEAIIKDLCPDYTFEQMAADHEATGYESKDEVYPVFKLALEYSLNASGLLVKLSCNGLQYDMSKFTLEDISILPYMGAGNTKNEGYNFYPDGSGSLFDFSLTKGTSVRGKIYGTDYAYHELTGTYQKDIRFPVYGTVATEVLYNYSYTEEGSSEVKNVTVSNTVMTKKEIEEFLAKDGIDQKGEITEKSYRRGYVAIIESGESLGEIETCFDGDKSDYATMMNHFNPKPKDSYDISDSISVAGNNSTWTVVSNRKYAGTIKIQYRMLSDEGKYETTWLGMANAYRDYLIEEGKLTKLTENDVKENTPLYIESFGAIETQKTVATIPVDVMMPLSTFENVWTMYQELSEAGVKNVNFKLTGFANGGIYSTVPSSLKWESAVGGKSGFKKLLEHTEEVAEKGDGSSLGLFPDFDFAYSMKNTSFDALNLKKDVVRTIDNRYASKRQYSATQQKYVSFYQLAISPARYSKFYEKLLKNYGKYEIGSMSVGSIGTALNTDFDEDDPYNREDNKSYTVKAFEDLEKSGYSLMTDGGNAYTWAYVDHILNAELDSSRYVQSSAAVPFLGAVLHGYIQFAGTPINEEGDPNYAILKAVENGAGLYFVLSYQNTQLLKEDEILSQYYSIRYDIWKDDVVKYYSELNSLLSDVQTKTIIDHKFLNYSSVGSDGNAYMTERILDIDELQAEIKEELEKAKIEQETAQRDQMIKEKLILADARLSLENAAKTILGMQSVLDGYLAKMETAKSDLQSKISALTDQPSDASLNEIKELCILIWNLYEKAEDQWQQIQNYESKLQAAKQTVEDRGSESQKTLAGTRFTNAQSQIGGIAEPDSPESVLTGAISDTLLKASAYDLTIAEVKEKGKYEPVVPVDPEESETEENEVSRYAVTNNRVVAVTYGDDNGTTKVPYKTFLLNYNSYAVSVIYEGVTYTVDSCGYVMIQH